ncbi:hypothetical protein F5148DRAFT_890384 [Russula earlei]|uniref:Uncharacterized protein n=1 Tax=Russula earlei TaxID=71964 RepID=A0ACC0UAH9_9AGAM|nr:hypothetical protein F5148DRAFT_890384 [Russula earlei]
MVASLNNEQYTPFSRASPPEPEGFQSSEDDSELHSPVFEHPLAAFLPTESRYHPIASDCLLPRDTLIAPPNNFQCYPQSQGFGAHHHGYPKEPPNTALAYNASVQSHTQSFTSSAYELAMPHCFPLLMNPALNRSTTTSLDVPPLAPHIHPSHFHSSVTTTAPIPQAPLHSPAGTIDPSTSSLAVLHPDASLASSSRAGPPRNLSSGVIACRQCRSRKIRCDSTRPNCQNCIKRGNECVYDKVPKRRGPDKRPGTRKRSCKKRQSDGSDPQPKKKRRTDPVDQVTTAHAGYTLHEAYYVKPSPSSTQTPSTSRPSRSEIQPGQAFSRSFESDLRSPELSSYEDPSPSLAETQVVQYRKAWWDNILDTYARTPEQSLEAMANDLNNLFTSCGHWLTFFNVHWFLRDLFDSNARTHMQPALVYACLAMAMLVRSSEIERGASGRAHALRLRDAARAHLHESWNLQWVDLGLAEAAMVLALFETSAHPQYDDASVEAALILLDKIIAALQLTALDARDPDALDHSTGVPTVMNPRPLPKQCDCDTLPPDSSTTWSLQLAWDSSWTEAEVKSEETRRLCWSALILVANHTAERAAEQRQPLDLFLVDPSNFRLLFPGEYHQRREYVPPYKDTVSPYSGKDSVWALYCRSMLLWNCTLRFWDERLATEERTRIACAAFVETRVVENALDAHVCNIDTALIYMCREFISNIRLEVTYLTRSILLDLNTRAAKPVWNHRLAEEWLYYQEQVVKRIRNPLTRITEPSAHVTLRRPFHIGWFTNQVATCLALWEGDRDLLRALELAKSFLVSIDVLNSLWPSQAFHLRGRTLRGQLSQACASAGIPPPQAPTTPDFAPQHLVT